jgi:signal transduction histidine kinase
MLMNINGHDPAVAPSRVAGGSATGVLADVDIVAELAVRPSRLPDYEREHHAFALLTAELSENPRNMLQKLAEVAVQLCDAHTAGISLLEGDVFRWEAVAGVFAAARGGTMPRSESPCGVCIDRGATQLMRFADRCFPALSANPRFVEMLLIPFYDHGVAVGTVWVVSHTLARTFDREDERIVRALSGFASVGWQLWQASEVMAALNRRKGTFLATLGHELRSPLAAIQTAASVLRTTSDHPMAAPAIAIIDRQTHHISRLLDDLLDVARIDSGKLQLERQTVDMRAVVAETVASRRMQLERRHQAISLESGQRAVAHRSRSGPARAGHLKPGGQCGQIHTGTRQGQCHRDAGRRSRHRRGARHRRGCCRGSDRQYLRALHTADGILRFIFRRSRVGTGAGPEPDRVARRNSGRGECRPISGKYVYSAMAERPHRRGAKPPGHA